MVLRMGVVVTASRRACGGRTVGGVVVGGGHGRHQRWTRYVTARRGRRRRAGSARPPHGPQRVDGAIGGHRGWVGGARALAGARTGRIGAIAHLGPLKQLPLLLQLHQPLLKLIERVRARLRRWLAAGVRRAVVVVRLERALGERTVVLTMRVHDACGHRACTSLVERPTALRVSATRSARSSF